MYGAEASLVIVALEVDAILGASSLVKVEEEIKERRGR
jgi:hypothetical protein